jgi:HK97 family phage portal protein
VKINLPFFKKKSAKFYYNNIIADAFPTLYTNSDTSFTGIIKTAETLPDVFMITDKLATIISNLPIKIVDTKGNDKKNPDLERLLRQPNYYQNWNELIKSFVGYYELLGNAYLYMPETTGIKTPTQLFCLPADQVGVVLLSNNIPSWLNEITGYKVTMMGKEYYLPYERILHKREITYQFNQGAWAYGISKYIPGDKIATELKAIYDAKTSIIASRGAMGILSNESQIPNPDETKEIKERLKGSYGLGSNQDKIIATTEKLSWQQMSLGIAELQIIENAKYSFDRLCQLNGFDPVIFSTDGSTFANKETAYRQLYADVIKPKVLDFYVDFNEWIMPYFGGDQIIVDWDQVSYMQKDLQKLGTIAALFIDNGLMTPKEAYEFIFNKPSDNTEISDEYYLKSSLKPKEMPEPEPAQPEPDIIGELMREQQSQENDNGNGKAKNI